MNKKQKLFPGFTVLTITVIFTMAGCASMAEFFKLPEFPSDFTGTWERADQSKYTNTLTFTSKTIKASNRESNWNIEGVSGDVYRIYIPKETGYNASERKITIKLNNGNLDIVANEADSTTTGWQNTENDYTGSWKRIIEIPEQKFDRAEALKEYLGSPLENSLSNPIKVAVTVNDQTLKDIVDVIKSADKYVSLNLTGNALTTIGEDAFKDCKKLRIITIPDKRKMTHFTQLQG